MAAFISELNYVTRASPPEYVEIAVRSDEDPGDLVVSFYDNNGTLKTTDLSASGVVQGEVRLSSLTGVPDNETGWTIYTIAGTDASRDSQLLNGGAASSRFEANYVALSRIEDDGSVTSLDAVGVFNNRAKTLSGGFADGVTARQVTAPGTTGTLQIDGWGNVTRGPKTVNDAVTCFAAGTLIETEVAPVPVERLEVGMFVLTRDDGMQPVRWVGCRLLDRAALSAAPHLRPIRVRKGALGRGLPSSDLLVSPQHRMLVCSDIAERMFGAREVLVAAKQLLELDGIELADDVDEVRYCHFIFDRHQIVLSNGAPTESLFTGPEALRSVGPAARAELFEIFPELLDADAERPAARLLVPGRRARQLAARHHRNERALLG